ncbi:holin [Clostridia bacterium]|nr:holin [Clostridia bacterium]
MYDLSAKLPIFSTVIAVLGGISGELLGGIDGLLKALVIFVVIDYITGIMCAFNDRTLNSEIGFRGIFKKVLIFLLIIVANVIDNEILGGADIARAATICFYASNESISILENAAKLGMPIPKKLRGLLEQLNREEKDNERT